MRKSKWITALFLGCLFLTALASVAKPDRYFSEKEKRYLAQKPHLTAENLISGSYGKDYESWLNDQFPLREQLTAWRTVCERFLGKSEIGGIYFGKEDYFIEHHTKSIYATELAEKNKDAVLKFLREMEQRLGEDRVRFLPVPSSETVLTGYLPDGAPPSAELTVLKEYGKETFSAAVKDALISFQNENEAQLYYRTDHHWTMEGAFVGYCEWADSVGITPKQREEFSDKILKTDFYGTVSAKINAQAVPDSLLALIPKFNVEYLVEYPDSTVPETTLYAEEMLYGPEPYGVYLKGNQSLTRIRTIGAGDDRNGRKLLVVKDSFGNSLVPFLVNHYPETLVIDLRYYNQSLGELIRKEQITDICVVYNTAQMAKETSLYKINR